MDDLIIRLAEARSKRDEYAQLVEEIEAKIIEQYGTSATFKNDEGETYCEIGYSKRFNPDHAAKVLPPTLRDLVTVPKIDSKLAKKLLPPEVYRACQVQSANPSIRLAE